MGMDFDVNQIKTFNSLQLSIVVPIYKEAAHIKPFLAQIESILDKIKVYYRIIFCLDPSPDNTEAIFKKNRTLFTYQIARFFSTFWPAQRKSCQGKTLLK